MPEVFVAFGVTGDLMRQKILPELFLMHTQGELPEHFEIIGISRKSWSDREFREYVAGIVGGDESFLNRLRFVQGDVLEKQVFDALSSAIGAREAILYIALKPTLYKNAFENLVASSLIKNSEKLRIMIEKPFGTSGVEAHELNETLYHAFSESQIYRVDHYLAKESLAQIPPLSLENLKEIRVTFLQKEGVEKRGAFFDVTGATRDLGQNHMMLMLTAALSAKLNKNQENDEAQGVVTTKLDEDRGVVGCGAEDRRRDYSSSHATSPVHTVINTNARVAVLNDLHALSPQEIATKTSRAQWSGYRSVVNVAPDSQIETYFKIESSWRGVPVVFEAGKYMQEDRKEILLTYQDGSKKGFTVENNKIKKEHEILIMECMRGNHGLFLSAEEIAVQWRFIDPVLEEWKSGKPPLESYE